jgi:hypothetical protein
MPTFIDLQRKRPMPTKEDLALQELATQYGEEVIADSRAGLTPSQQVDRKLASRASYDAVNYRAAPVRPRAK